MRKTSQNTGKTDTPGTGRSTDRPDHDRIPTTETGAVPEIGGRKGPDPTRYGDWEKDGRCIDF